jgi:adenylate cyclase
VTRLLRSVTGVRDLDALGMAGWREEANEAVAMAREADAITYVMATTYKYVPAQFGAITLDNKSLDATAEALRIAEESGDNFTVGFARYTRGLVLIHHGGADSEQGLRNSPLSAS